MHAYGNRQDVANNGGVVLSLIITGTEAEIALLRSQLRDSVSWVDGNGEFTLPRQVDEPLVVLEQTIARIAQNGTVEP